MIKDLLYLLTLIIATLVDILVRLKEALESFQDKIYRSITGIQN